MLRGNQGTQSDSNNPDRTMETYASLLAESVSALRARGVTECTRTARWIMTDVVGCSSAHLLAFPHEAVSSTDAQRIRRKVLRRAAHEPLQYILGYADFCGLRIHVNPAVLIPRPESEQVVEAALSLVSGTCTPRVLDIGTGSGCLALAIKRKRPDASVWACDISSDALEVARQNAAELELAVSLLRADIFSSSLLEQLRLSSFDLIISNPPYVPNEEMDELPPEIVLHEPWDALCAGPDPMRFYNRIASCLAPALLKDEGHLVVEIHANQSEAACSVMRTALLSNVSLRADISGKPRIVTAQNPLMR